MNEICTAHISGGMNVSQLIAELQKLPGDAEVCCPDGVGRVCQVSEIYFDDEPDGRFITAPTVNLR